jgi:hypothetical protein
VPTVVLVAVDSEETRAEAIAVAAELLRVAASPARWLRRQTSSASRSATPTVAGSRSSGSLPEGGEVKDLRSGDQHPPTRRRGSRRRRTDSPQVRWNRDHRGLGPRGAAPPADHRRLWRTASARPRVRRAAVPGARPRSSASLGRRGALHQHGRRAQAAFDRGEFVSTHVLLRAWHFALRRTSVVARGDLAPGAPAQRDDVSQARPGPAELDRAAGVIVADRVVVTRAV